MDNKLFLISFLISQTSSILARSVIKTYEKSSDVAKWTVFIGIKNDECAGLQVNSDWILTLGECVDSRKLSKIKVTFSNGKQSKVIAEERSPEGKGLLVLLKLDATAGVMDKFTEFASSLVPNNYQYQLYNLNSKDVITSNDVTYVNSKECTKDKRLKQTFDQKQYTCLNADVNKKNKCVPGLPVFGTKKKSTLLQGLSTTGEQFCDSKVQATVPVSLHKTWIESVITETKEY
ncbi:uncharacterized protein LOC132731476 [Ruditapes philippinarum]|uniref:uncharacterized protein LOC132731476 n=1 Tax=Ruditapes philippinarum TaxID=129788 RepID=UPI00295AF65C|nr:uncharacterized protein LOC132731476 [Ruditapes philippinarum]